MKKLFTLAFMAFFFCLGTMAQVVLGDIKFSIKDGQKVNPATGKITVTFPDVTGVEDPTATSFVLEGNLGNEDTAFDGLEGTFAAGVTFDLAEFELQPSTEYALTITSVKVDGTELAAEGGYVLHFKTRGAERKMSWSFALSESSLEQIVADAAANTEGLTSQYIDITKNNTPRYYVPARNYEEIMLPDGTALPETEDLLFKFGEKAFYVSGSGGSGSWADAICFNNNNQIMVIPDCKVGDVITLNALYSSKNKGWIQAVDGCAIVEDGLVSTATGLQDSIRTGSSAANYKFEVQVEGDVQIKFGNTILRSIKVEEFQEKKQRNYNVVAAYTNDEEMVVLKELVPLTSGTTGSTLKVKYPYWLVDGEGNAYTHGSKGNPFEEVLDLKNGEGDTTFVVNYKKTAYTGVVYLSEGEDIPNAVLCTSPNAEVRSSMGKSAYFTEDQKLVTLEAGTYKIRGVLFDANKTPGYVCTLTKGEGEENEIYLSANATNWTEAESDLLTITEPTDITLKAGGGETTGLDVIMIYASTDAPEDPDNAVDAMSADKKAGVRKVAKDGRILIETAAGTFNVVGIQVK